MENFSIHFYIFKIFQTSKPNSENKNKYKKRFYSCFRLVGDVLLGTAFLSYSGPFNQEFRKMLEMNWQKELRQRKIPFSSNLNVTLLLIDGPTVSLTIMLPNLFMNDSVWCNYINIRMRMAQDVSTHNIVRMRRETCFVSFMLPTWACFISLVSLYCLINTLVSLSVPINLSRSKCDFHHRYSLVSIVKLTRLYQYWSPQIAINTWL